jgi:hypothetical protein
LKSARRTKTSKKNSATPASPPGGIVRNKRVAIWASCCPHIGAPACNYSLLNQHVADAVKYGRNLVLLGDTFNNGVSAGSSHLGLEYGDIMTPMEQVDLAIDTYMPLAAEKRIALMVGGNHPYRTMRACGINPEMMVAMMLSVGAGGKKPKAIIPPLVQRMHELAMLGEGARAGGRQYALFTKVRADLMAEINKIAPEPQSQWEVPFSPGVGHVTLQGVPIIGYHGKHNRSRDNWATLEKWSHGFRLYFTGHNHRLGWEPGFQAVRGKTQEVDFFSCGTYQGYEEYALVAGYGKMPCGSMLVEYDPDKDKAYFEKLD